MTPALPPSVRAAAGLAARTLDEARALPRRLVSLPVLVAGAAMQASLRLQQEYAGLVARGDELLVNFGGGGDDAPPWATFDEDAAPTAGSNDLRRRAGRTTAAEPASAPAKATRRATVESILAVPDGAPSAFDRELKADPLTDVPAAGTTTDTPEAGATTDIPLARTAAAGSTTDSPAVLSHATTSPVPGYDDWTVAQLRARLRRLPIADLAPLLQYEQIHRARTAYLTMLQNRLTTTEKP